MQMLLYILFSVVFISDFTQQGLVIPKAIRLLPEVVSLLGTFAVVGLVSKNKMLSLSTKYWIFFLIFAVHLLNGIVINDTPTGAIVAGLRVYLKYIPFFVLPLVYEFSEDQIQRQMKVLLTLLVFQLPIALMQKLFIATNESGDWIRGTFSTSSILSTMLISGIAILFALYLRKRIPSFQFAIFFVLLLAPAMFNETKGTLILLPIAMFVPLYFDRDEAGNKRNILPFTFAIVFVMGTFVTVYDTFWGQRYEQQGGSVVDFFTSDALIRYLAPRSGGFVEEDREQGPTGRIDKILISLANLQRDPVLVVGGLGMGNVTPSPVDFLSGDYQEYEQEGLVSTSFAYLLLETGILGVILSYIFLYMVFRDSLYISRQRDLSGALGLGWMAVVCIVGLTFFYKNTIEQNAMMYLFWFYSGCVVSRRFRLERSATEALNKEKAKPVDIAVSAKPKVARVVRQDSRTKWLVPRK